LGIPNLYERKVIFYREEKNYCFTKGRIEYVVRSHHMKTDMSLVNTKKIKRIVNARNNLSLVSIKSKEECYPKHNNEIVKYVTNYDKAFHDSHVLQYDIPLHASTKDTSLQPMVESDIDPLVNDIHVKKRNNIVDSF